MNWILLLSIIGLIVASCAVYLFYWHYYQPYVLYKKSLGLDGPTPVFWHGNTLELRKHGTNIRDDWCAVYGNTYLYFMGIQPYIYTRDINIIRAVFLNKASHFIDRGRVVPILFDKKGDLKNLLTTTGDEWRRTRRILHPLFGAKKIKLMSSPAEVCCSRFVTRLTDAVAKAFTNNSSVLMDGLFATITTEVVMSCTFGRDMNAEEGIGKKLCDAMAQITGPAEKESSSNPYLVLVALSHSRALFLPILHRLVRLLPIAKHWDFIRDVAEQLVRERKEGRVRRKDSLQMLVDATDEEAGEKGRSFNDEEVYGNAMSFILAGNLTTRHTISAAACLLVQNPDVQNQLIEKIQNYYLEHPDSSYYDAAVNIEYLEMVLLETLRLYPIAPALNRMCVKTCTIDEHLVVPKQSVLITGLDALHHDPEFWPEPEKFDPERFGPNVILKQGSYMGFGAGPRMCLGKRLGLINSSMVLVAMLKKYRLGSAKDALPLETAVTYSLGYCLKHPVKLNLIPL